MASSTAAAVGGVVIGVGLSLILNAVIAAWFARSGIHSLSGRLTGRDWADSDKVARAAEAGKAWQRRYADVSGKFIPVGVVMIIAGVVIVFL